MMRQRVMPDEVRVGDVLSDPHLSGRQGEVVEVVLTWYGAAITYRYDGHTCASAIWNEDVQTAAGLCRAGIEVER